MAVVPDFHKRILFSDEAHFWLNGYVNKQNCRIWSEANPQVYVEAPLHPEKLTVWCALWAGGIIGRSSKTMKATTLQSMVIGYVKSLVYADKPQTLDHLEDNIRLVIADIRPQMLEKVIENWTSRLDYIRASRGSPMPEINLKMSPLALITAATRRGIDSTSLWERSTGMSYQILAKAVRSSGRFVGAVRWSFTFYSKTSHRF
ncbi:uncharacterized protein TNCV_2143721 [Trichonephila clavipes]|nr:uncharacterized protein TNCV_2143721 [Trichonephila clavipes]